MLQFSPYGDAVSGNRISGMLAWVGGGWGRGETGWYGTMELVCRFCDLGRKVESWLCILSQGELCFQHDFFFLFFAVFALIMFWSVLQWVRYKLVSVACIPARGGTEGRLCSLVLGLYLPRAFISIVFISGWRQEEGGEGERRGNYANTMSATWCHFRPTHRCSRVKFVRLSKPQRLFREIFSILKLREMKKNS